MVVSSGIKVILDVPATAELLKTLSVPVLGWRTETLPVLYRAEGGPTVAAALVDSAVEVARVAQRAASSSSNVTYAGLRSPGCPMVVSENRSVGCRRGRRGGRFDGQRGFWGFC